MAEKTGNTVVWVLDFFCPIFPPIYFFSSFSLSLSLPMTLTHFPNDGLTRDGPSCAWKCSFYSVNEMLYKSMSENNDTEKF